MSHQNIEWLKSKWVALSSFERRSINMDFKKIEVDEDTYIRYRDADNFELHIRATGPLGAWVYKYTNGLLDWRQRRSYSFVTRPAKPKWIED